MRDYSLFIGISDYFYGALTVCVIWAVIRMTNQTYIEFRKQFNIEWYCFNFYLNPFFVLLSRIIFIGLLLIFFYIVHLNEKITELYNYNAPNVASVYLKYDKPISDYCFFFWFFLFGITVIWDFCVEIHIKNKVRLKAISSSESRQNLHDQITGNYGWNSTSINSQTVHQSVPEVNEVGVINQQLFYVDVGYIMGIRVDPFGVIPPEVKRNGDYIFKVVSQENVIFGKDETYSVLASCLLNISKVSETDRIRFLNNLMKFHDTLMQLNKKQ